jgi:hypothetical protein
MVMDEYMIVDMRDHYQPHIDHNQKSLYLYEVVFVLTIMTIIIIFDYDDCYNDYDNINNSHDDYNDSDYYVALMVQDRLLSHLK